MDTMTKTRDLTTMPEDTLLAQIEANRENAKKCADAITNHVFGEQKIEHQGENRWALNDRSVSTLNVGDLIAVKDTSGRYGGRLNVGQKIDLTGYSSFDLYRVLATTAKRVKVERVYLPTGYYDNEVGAYDTMLTEQSGYSVEMWGDKNERYIFVVGTVAEAAVRLSEVGHRVERYTRLMAGRKAMQDELQRRQAIKDAEVEALREPRKTLVRTVNEAAGMTLLYFATWGGSGEEGAVEWSYEMRGQSYNAAAPNRFILGLAAEVIRSRRLLGKISLPDYMLIINTVETLPGGDKFLDNIKTLDTEDDGTED